MKQRLVLIGLLALAAGAGGCSQPTVNTAEQPASNAAGQTETSFANITDPRAALAEGDRLFDENQTELAIEAYKHAVKLDPELADGYFKLGIAYALLDLQNQQAGVVTEQPANSKDKPAKPRWEKAFEQAVEAYKKWIDNNPKDDVAHYNLGRTYAKLMLDEDAEKAFKQAVKLKPEDSEYQTELGAVLVKLAQYHEAIEPLKKAIELDAGNVRAQDLLEDAQAGRQRIDYVSNKKDVNANANVKSNSNTNSNSAAANSNSNTAPKPPSSNKPRNDKEAKPASPANRPR